MLSVAEAQAIASVWRPQFTDEAAFEVSWTRFFEMVGDPTRQRLESWLTQDLAKDAVKNAGIIREPILPSPSHFALGDCMQCGGKWFVRKDVPIGHCDFGKAFPCPACNSARGVLT